MPREIPCPNCTEPAGSGSGSIITKTAGRIFSSISGFLQRSFSIRIPTEIVNYVKERIPVTKKAALNNKCGRCKGEGVIIDPSDDTEKYEEAAAIAESRQEEIIQNEALLGPGGNRYTIVAGSDLLEVGIGMNDAPSYRVDPCGSVRNWGNAGPGTGEGQVNPNVAGLSVPRGAPANHIQGLNPPASPGGHYVIKCSNKFSLVTGAQGVDITTSGPITINGGITQITGPEVTIGTQTGRLVLEGETVNIGGKSVEVAPSDGHFYVRGTISNSGNVMCGGHAHMESASVVKLETTGRNEQTKIASASNVYGGPAFWGGPAVEGVVAAARELVSYTTTNVDNPEMFFKNLTSPRYYSGLGDVFTNLAYTLREIELVPTGLCLTLVGPGIVFNFPHIHAEPDGMHTHETRVPDIDCSTDSAKQLRAKQAGIESPAPLDKKDTNLIDVLVNTIWALPNAAWALAKIPIQQFNFLK